MHMNSVDEPFPKKDRGRDENPYPKKIKPRKRKRKKGRIETSKGFDEYYRSES